MGVILEEYKGHLEEYKDVIPDQIMDLILSSMDDKAVLFEADSDDISKFFVPQYDELSEAIFNLLHSGKGYYIINYRHKFCVNRKASGFNKIEDLVHYAMWVIEDYTSSKSKRKNYLDELKKNSIGKSPEEIIMQTLLEIKLTEELKEVTYNMKSDEDFMKRLTLIKELDKHKTLQYHLITSLSHYKIMDSIFDALSNIPNVHLLNIVPDPVEQSEWEARTV